MQEGVMALELLSLLVALVLCAWVFLRERRHRQRRSESGHGQLPPGPRPWPLLGNLLHLSPLPHRSAAALARRHGPVVTLRLGAIPTMVVSSAAAAREMFRDCDAPLAGRTIYEAMRYGTGSVASLITAQHGPRWRMLRRLSATGLFAGARVDAARGVRAACTAALVQSLAEASSRPVDLGQCFFRLAFQHTGILILSRDILELGFEEGAEFFYHAERIMELVGKPNAADFFPVLRGIDPQGIRRGTELHIGRALRIVEGFVKQRVERRRDGEDGSAATDDDRKKDFLDVLLEFEGDGVTQTTKLPTDTITGIMLEMFIAGTDTTAGTMEWAMAELLHHPSAMSKVQAELRQSIPYGKEVGEKDVVDLPYLRAVISETLRLHPPLPFLVPHKAMQPCTLLGYHVPEDTQVLVNVWGIGRDPEAWEDPEAFKPERFMDDGKAGQLDYKGQCYDYIPFGSGRRICPAISLVSRLLPLVLGTLLYSFDWSLADGKFAEEMDMRERLGTSLRRAVPLNVIPRPYSRN